MKAFDFDHRATTNGIKVVKYSQERFDLLYPDEVSGDFFGNLHMLAIRHIRHIRQMEYRYRTQFKNPPTRAFSPKKKTTNTTNTPNVGLSTI